MTKKRTIVAFALSTLGIFFAPWAGAFENLVLTGYVESDNRMTIEEESDFVFNEATLGLTVEAFPESRIAVFGSARLIAVDVENPLDHALIVDIDDQQYRWAVDPVRLELDEAYMNITGLWLDDLDVRIGKQRITWGTGDQFNPTDNLNSDDFHDPLRFGRKIPTPAVLANYYAGPVTITGVVSPLFYPALLPTTELRKIFELQFDNMSSGIDIDTGFPALDRIFDNLMTDALQMASLGSVAVVSKRPERNVESVNAALKAAATVGSMDLSASYAYVHDDFGVPSRITMTVEPFGGGFEQIVDEVDLHILQGFPKLHVIGADFAANVPKLEIGVWGEVGYFIPERIETAYVVDAGDAANAVFSAIAGEDLSSGVVISREDPLEENYVKAVAGADYTFPGAWYANVQYVRGLPTDNTAGLMENYIFGGVEKPFLHDMIKTRIFSGVCIGDESWILYPEVFFYPMDALELRVGALLVFGELDTKFGAFGDDIVFVRAKVSF